MPPHPHFSPFPCYLTSHFHRLQHFLSSYGDADHQGEAAYYTTCLHAAVEFVMRLSPPTDTPTAVGTVTHSGRSQHDIDRYRSSPNGVEGVEGGESALFRSAASDAAATASTETDTHLTAHPHSHTHTHTDGPSTGADTDAATSAGPSEPHQRSGSSMCSAEEDEEARARVLQGLDEEYAAQAQYDDDVQAVARLGEWLREQQTVEDALVLLQQEGWMF